MSSALIPLQGQQPTFTSPITNLSQLLQAKDLASQIQMRQAQAGDIDAQREQRNKDLQDQNIIQESMKDPAVSAKVHAGDFSALEGKVQPKTLDAVRQSQTEFQAKLLTNTEQQNKIRRDALSEVNNTVAGLQSLGDIGKINAALPSAVQNLAASGALKNAGIDPSKIPQSISDPQQLQNLLATTGGVIAAHDKALATQEAQGKATKATADAAIAQGQADNMTPDGLLPQQKVQAAQAAATLARENAAAAETARHNRADESAANTRAGLEGQRVGLEQTRINLEKGGLTANQVNQAATKAAQPYSKMLTDGSNQLEKIAEAKTMINGPAEYQALGIPKVLTALVSGQGSGVRITQPELNSIANARGLAGGVEGFLNSIAGQGKLTSTQKSQLTGILDDVANRVKSKQMIVNDHLDALGGSNSREEIQAHEHNTRQKLAAFERDTVEMVSPTGQRKPVPRSQVEHYKSLGAKEAQ